MEFITNTPEETTQLGRRLGMLLAQRGTPSFVAMYGDLGAGKTVFVRGMGSALSPGSRVKSPTYTLVNEYRRGTIPFFHFDLYRIADAGELDGFGFDEYLTRGICVAEWSEHLGKDIPEGAVLVTIEKAGESQRRITVNGLGEGETL
ncbi:MAG: tRNA (adenosine(37)-N6)-threonylcarbamoyltransferase complex ATPase subunit type 1 TsaE [Clostridiales bacterium]|nr:tRNA (adenosine(37)-N6)-threonylcarbamoyltransferase complex ATPase subunit type 1 TsaE [Clostridiales bacterium]